VRGSDADGWEGTMNTDFLKDIIDGPGTKASRRRHLRRYARAIEKMHSALAILHTWCKHAPTSTTHGQIVGMIESTLEEVGGLEEQNRKERG
jgi:hypothetical protein